MLEFVKKYALIIILMLFCLIIGGSSAKVMDKVFPTATGISREIMKDLLVDALKDPDVKVVQVSIIREEVKEMKDTMNAIADSTFEEWVRFINKQYLKVSTNRDDLSWSDVGVALSRWSKLPDCWNSPDLSAKVIYLQKKYDEYIAG